MVLPLLLCHIPIYRSNGYFILVLLEGVFNLLKMRCYWLVFLLYFMWNN